MSTVLSDKNRPEKKGSAGLRVTFTHKHSTSDALNKANAYQPSPRKDGKTSIPNQFSHQTTINGIKLKKELQKF